MGWVWKDDDESEEFKSSSSVGEIEAYKKQSSDEVCSTRKVVRSNCKTEEVEPVKFLCKCEKTEEVLREFLGNFGPASRLASKIDVDEFDEASTSHSDEVGSQPRSENRCRRRKEKDRFAPIGIRNPPPLIKFRESSWLNDAFAESLNRGKDGDWGETDLRWRRIGGGGETVVMEKEREDCLKEVLGGGGAMTNWWGMVVYRTGGLFVVGEAMAKLVAADWFR
ncbi:unnamed protein product [Linum trigynum]|uniref:Uncharacterized protein n=1 Tax=Linum trigynum TaxID=586398 RepID=A0AAV2D9G9_9ROSI